MGLVFNSFMLLLSTVEIIYSKMDAICFGRLDLDLPVRYLHIQIRENGRNITKSRGPMNMHINSPNCSFISDVVDRRDGMYVARVRLYASCQWLYISISLEEVKLCGSPILIQKNNGNLQPEKCSCPIPLEEWLLKAKCESERQITEDLMIWTHVNFSYFHDKAVDSWGGNSHRRSFSFCHYQIIDNQIYRQCFGEYDGFKTFVDDTLQSITSKMILPNTEFLFNLGDYPLSSSGPVPIPIISWCGSRNTFDIVVPTYEMSEAIRLDLASKSLSIHTSGIPSIPWENKYPLPVFRGRDSNQLRLSLAKLSDELPHLLDVGITDYFFHSPIGNPKMRNRMQFNEFFKHRYILSIDGTVAAYRLPFLLTGNSLVFKSDSTYYEHFYSKMQPFVHYIPFQFENIQDRIIWSNQFDHNETLRNARQFVLDHLQPINFYCYYAILLKKYTNMLLEQPVTFRDGLHNVELKDQWGCDCDYISRSEL